jgi:uncharacterized membrane protein YbhN (UPF0104 family)
MKTKLEIAKIAFKNSVIDTGLSILVVSLFLIAVGAGVAGIIVACAAIQSENWLLLFSVLFMFYITMTTVRFYFQYDELKGRYLP